MVMEKGVMKNMWIFLCGCFLVGFVFVSCGEDDDNEE